MTYVCKLLWIVDNQIRCSYLWLNMADCIQVWVLAEVGLKCQHFRPTCYTDNDSENKSVTVISMIQTFRPQMEPEPWGLDFQMAVISQRQNSFLPRCWTLTWQSLLLVLWLFNCWMMPLTVLVVRVSVRLTHTLVHISCLTTCSYQGPSTDTTVRRDAS